MTTRSPTRQKHPASMIFLKWDLVSSPASLCFSAQAPALQEKKTNPVLRIVSDKQDILFMCLFAPLPSQCLEVWLCLLLSPIATSQMESKNRTAFQKHSALGCSQFQWGQGSARAKGIPSQSVLGNRVQRTLVLLLKSYSLDFQEQFLLLFLLLSTHPLNQK